MKLSMSLTLDGLVRALRRTAHDTANTGPERRRSGPLGKTVQERRRHNRPSKGDAS